MQTDVKEKRWVTDFRAEAAPHSPWDHHAALLLSARALPRFPIDWLAVGIQSTREDVLPMVSAPPLLEGRLRQTRVSLCLGCALSHPAAEAHVDNTVMSFPRRPPGRHVGSGTEWDTPRVSGPARGQGQPGCDKPCWACVLCSATQAAKGFTSVVFLLKPVTVAWENIRCSRLRGTTQNTTWEHSHHNRQVGEAASA